jgi:hypothetical protein
VLGARDDRRKVGVLGADEILVFVERRLGGADDAYLATGKVRPS